MRIITGKHKSRILKTLQGTDTRPMTDKMKEAVFNTLGPYFDDIGVLDLFGGSGALSLEALSRGAKEAYIVDSSREAIKIINENIRLLKEEEHTIVLSMSYIDAIKRLKNLKFDLVFLDPPYRLNIIGEIIRDLIENKMLKKGTLIVCQYVRGNLEIPQDFDIVKNYTTGSSELTILRYK